MSRIFCIDESWINNFVNVLHQRIVAQNDGELIKCEANFIFENGRTVRIYSVEDLNHFNDMSSDRSIGLRVSLSYLISFPGRASSEVQEMNFSAIAGLTSVERSTTSLSGLRRLLIPLESDFSSMRFTVRSTDTTWGEDIVNLVNNRINSDFPTRNLFRQRARALLIEAYPVVTLLAIGLASFASVFRGETSKAEFIAKYADVFNDATTPKASLDHKINLLFQYTTYKRISLSDFVPSLWVLLFLSSIYAALRVRSRSFIILNSKSKNLMAAHNSSVKAVNAFLVVGLLTSMIGGVISSGLYAWLTGHFG